MAYPDPNSKIGVLRVCLMQADDPASIDADRLLAICRARWTQMGNDARDIDRDMVVKYRSKVKADCGGVLTKAALAKLVNGAVHANGKPAQTVAVPAVATTQPTATIERLRAAKAFVSLCGGHDKAKAALDLLGELMA